MKDPFGNTRIIDMLREDPDITLELTCELKSGNCISATVGPKVGEVIAVRVVFLDNPSAQDKAALVELMNWHMGSEPVLVEDPFKSGGKEAFDAEFRRICGGGQG